MHLKCPEWEKILLLDFSLLKNWKPSVRWGCRRVHDDLYFPFSSPFILCLSRQAVWLCGCARCREPAASASAAAARCRGGRGAAAPPCVRAPLLPPSAPSRSPALPPPATATLPSDPRSCAASWLLAPAKPVLGWESGVCSGELIMNGDLWSRCRWTRRWSASLGGTIHFSQ